MSQLEDPEHLRWLKDQDPLSYLADYDQCKRGWDLAVVISDRYNTQRTWVQKLGGEEWPILSAINFMLFVSGIEKACCEYRAKNPTEGMLAAERSFEHTMQMARSLFAANATRVLAATGGRLIQSDVDSWIFDNPIKPGFVPLSDEMVSRPAGKALKFVPKTLPKGMGEEEITLPSGMTVKFRDGPLDCSSLMGIADVLDPINQYREIVEKDLLERLRKEFPFVEPKDAVLGWKLTRNHGIRGAICEIWDDDQVRSNPNVATVRRILEHENELRRRSYDPLLSQGVDISGWTADLSVFMEWEHRMDAMSPDAIRRHILDDDILYMYPHVEKAIELENPRSYFSNVTIDQFSNMVLGAPRAIPQALVDSIPGLAIAYQWDGGLDQEGNSRHYIALFDKSGRVLKNHVSESKEGQQLIGQLLADDPIESLCHDLRNGNYNRQGPTALGGELPVMGHFRKFRREAFVEQPPVWPGSHGLSMQDNLDLMDRLRQQILQSLWGGPISVRQTGERKYSCDCSSIQGATNKGVMCPQCKIECQEYLVPSAALQTHSKVNRNGLVGAYGVPIEENLAFAIQLRKIAFNAGFSRGPVPKETRLYETRTKKIVLRELPSELRIQPRFHVGTLPGLSALGLPEMVDGVLEGKREYVSSEEKIRPRSVRHVNNLPKLVEIDMESFRDGFYRDQPPEKQEIDLEMYLSKGPNDKGELVLTALKTRIPKTEGVKYVPLRPLIAFSAVENPEPSCIASRPLSSKKLTMAEAIFQHTGIVVQQDTDKE